VDAWHSLTTMLKNKAFRSRNLYKLLPMLAIFYPKLQRIRSFSRVFFLIVKSKWQNNRSKKNLAIFKSDTSKHFLFGGKRQRKITKLSGESQKVVVNVSWFDIVKLNRQRCSQPSFGTTTDSFLADRSTHFKHVLHTGCSACKKEEVSNVKKTALF